MLTRRVYGWLLVTALAASCAPSAPTPTPSGTPTDPPAPTGRTLLAVYMIGSDLEDDVSPRNRIPDEQENGGQHVAGAASRDLHDLATAWKALGPEARANVEVVVGFGGARKFGWRGLKVATGDQLVADDEDGRFGNSGRYLSDQASLDLGTVAGLQAFLQQAQAQAADCPRQMLVFWDHGASYAGLGPDSTTGARLALPEIRQAMDAITFRTDVVGFDACHMASAEVLKAVMGHAGYMVASQEAVPSQGWSYGQLVSFLGARPDATYPALARSVVDAYMAPSHALSSSPRTLSVYDLARGQAVLSSLDSLSDALESQLEASFRPLLDAVGESHKFGSFGLGNQEIGVDLRQWASALAAHDAAPAASRALVAAIDACVIYNRESGALPGASGLMASSPRNIRLMEAGGYGTDSAATTAYWDLLHAVLRRAQAAPALPGIVSDEAAEVGGRAGRRIRLASEHGLDEVAAIHALRRTAEKYEMLERRPLDEGDGTNCFLPEWDGRALMLVAGRTRVRLPVTIESVKPDGGATGRVAIMHNDRPATLGLALDAAGLVLTHWVEPRDESDPANPAPGRHEAGLALHDSIAVQGQEFDLDARTVSASYGPTIPLFDTPAFVREAVAGEAVYFLEAADLLDRFQASAPRAARRATATAAAR